MAQLLVGSVGRMPVCKANEGCGFEPKPDQPSGSLITEKEGAVFAVTSANG